MGRRRHTPEQIITATSPSSVAPSHPQLSSTVLRRGFSDFRLPWDSYAQKNSAKFSIH